MKTATNCFSQAVWLALCAAFLTTNVCAQDQVTPSVMAKELHNPLSNLREVIFQLDILATGSQAPAWEPEEYHLEEFPVQQTFRPILTTFEVADHA